MSTCDLEETRHLALQKFLECVKSSKLEEWNRKYIGDYVSDDELAYELDRWCAWIITIRNKGDRNKPAESYVAIYLGSNLLHKSVYVINGHPETDMYALAVRELVRKKQEHEKKLREQWECENILALLAPKEAKAAAVVAPREEPTVTKLSLFQRIKSCHCFSV